MKKKIAILVIVIIIIILGAFLVFNKKDEIVLKVRLNGEFIENLKVVEQNGYYVTLDALIEENNELNDIKYIEINNEKYIDIKTLEEKFQITSVFDEETNTLFLETKNELLLEYEEALEIFKEGMIAEITDIETKITYKVRRVEGGFSTLADVETLTKEDTQKILQTTGGEWDNKRRAVIVIIGETNIAGSIAPFPHSGRDDMPFGEWVDNRSGATGSGINLNSIRDNEMNGVLDLFFYNSFIPGLNRIDGRHQAMVIEASKFNLEEL